MSNDKELDYDLVDTQGNERFVPYLEDLDWMKSLEPREVEEIRLAYFYAQSPHGTNGHNRLLLIAKLADRLSTIEDLIRAAQLGGFEEYQRIVDALMTGQG